MVPGDHGLKLSPVMLFVRVKESKKNYEHVQIHFMTGKNALEEIKLKQHQRIGLREEKLPAKTQSSVQVRRLNGAIYLEEKFL